MASVIEARYPNTQTIAAFCEFIDSGKTISPRLSENGIPAYEVGHILPRELKDTDLLVSNDSDKVLQRHDLLTGGVGTIGVFAEYNSDLPASFSNNILRIRPKEHEKHRAAFVAEYLNSNIGNTQLVRGSRGSLQKFVTQKSLGEIVIPMLGRQQENQLVAEMDAARAQRKAQLAEADALLAGIDGFVLDTLGLSLPRSDFHQVFGISASNVQKRLDPHFHSPQFVRIQEILSQTQCETLNSIVTFSKEIWKSENHKNSTFKYIEISSVNPKTGEAYFNDVPTDKAPSRARMKVQSGDIIVSLTRPHHGSIAYLGSEFADCVASTGFAVIRDIATHVRRDYLWGILRTQLSLSQMIQRSSGSSYPAIIEPELGNITVPIPNMEIQEVIASEIKYRHNKAQGLRADAETSLQEAKQQFQEKLLGAEY